MSRKAKRRRGHGKSGPKLRFLKADQPKISVFVVMPFTESPTRNAQQLATFYENAIKNPIESAKLLFKYSVRRSDDRLNITEEIIRDLYSASIVICDLSGIHANPNVMYELGLRLGFSERPVILIREAHKENRNIFDVSGLYTEPYDPLNYPKLSAYLIEKLRRWETGEQPYRSPILSVLHESFSMPDRIAADRAWGLLYTLDRSLLSEMIIFGRHVARFIASRSELRLKSPFSDFKFYAPGDRWKITDELKGQVGEFMKIDWKEFESRPSPIPGIDLCLSTGYLTPLLPHDVEFRFTECLRSYHSQVLAEWFWKAPQARGERLVVYFSQTAAISTMCGFVAAMLRAKSKVEFEEPKRYFDDIFDRMIKVVEIIQSGDVQHFGLGKSPPEN